MIEKVKEVSEDNLDGHEPESVYTLSCVKCKEAFYSPDAFPSPHLCPQCLKPKISIEEARGIAEKAFGSRPDLPSGKAFVDEIRHHKKPDEGSLLIDEEINRIEEDWLMGEEYNDDDAKRRMLLEAQRDLTRGKCQERVERIFREIEGSIWFKQPSWPKESFMEWWQALKTEPEKLGVATPISLETPEDYEKASQALKREAQRQREEAMTPEERATRKWRKRPGKRSRQQPG